MDPLLITGVSLGGLLLTSSLWWRAGRGRRRVRQDAVALRSDLTKTRRSLESVRVGEREAAWAVTATARRLDRTMVDLGKSIHEAKRLEGDLDELRKRLGAADRELDRLRTDHDEASTRVATLESQLDRSRRESAGAAQQLDGFEQRLNAVVKERDLLSAAAQQSAQLEAELAALGRVHKELTASRTENEALRTRLAAPTEGDQPQLELLQRETAELRSQLTEADRQISDAADELRSARQRVTELEAALASQPEVEDLQGALATGAEATTYADWDRTLRKRITASVEEATERLQSQVDHLRLVIAEKERLLQNPTSSTADTSQAPVTAIRGVGPVIAAILAKQGIDSVEAIAALSESDIDRLGAEMPVYPDRIRRDDWVGQARALLG